MQAREMKHRQEDGEVEEEEKNQKGKAKNKNKKKGVEKYIGQRTQEADEKLNPDKVLFFKKKNQGDKTESASSQKQQI